MFRFRFWMALLMCLCLCMPAQAAKRKDAGIASPVKPYAYDAQDNAKKIPNMLDDETPTSYYYTVYNSKRSDSIPELTFWFDHVTLGSIWMRNGDCESADHYWADARPHLVTVRIYTGDIGYTDIEFEMEDVYDPDTENEYWHKGYQILPLPALYADTTRVDLFIRQWKDGSENRYNINITDIVFSEVGADSETIASPEVRFAVKTQAPSATKAPAAAQNPYTGVLLDKLSGRTGPSTVYGERGTFLSAGQKVKVISKGYDTRNDIWWVQCEFTVNKVKHRAYTGLKRVDIDISLIPEEKPVCTAKVIEQVTCYVGPGEDYARHKKAEWVKAGTEGIVISIEDGYAEFEYMTGKVKKNRMWLPVEALEMGGPVEE